MSKRSDTLSTTALTLAILARLDPIVPTSAPALRDALADRFDRDLRTFQRLLAMLTDEGFAVCNATSRPHSYLRSAKSHKLVEPLTAEEAMLLRLAKGQLDLILAPESASKLAQLLDRARAALAPKDAASDMARRAGTRPDPRREREWLRKVAIAPVSMPLLPPPVDKAVQQTVTQALFDDHWLDIDYQPAGRALQIGKRVMPLGLMQQGPRLYLIARYEGHDDERQLALHRLRAARAVPLPLPADRPPFDLEAYIRNGRPGFGSGRQVPVVFHIDADAGAHLKETPLSADQQVKKDADGWLRVSATVAHSLWFWDWLRGFGNRAYLAEPSEWAESYWDEAIPGA